jgi:MFS family permease
MSDDPAIVRRTQVVDLLRAVPMGVLLPLETSILLTIAIKQFDASALAKGVIAASAGVGLLMSPVVTAVARRSGRPVMLVAAAIAAIGAVGYVLGVLGALPMFVAGAVVGVAAPNAVFPLLTLTYERNFPAAERGRRVGWGMSLRVGVAAVVGLVVGALLRNRLDLWWTVVLAGAVASALLAALQTATPSQPLDRVPGQRNRPWPHFHLVASDRQLRLTLVPGC